MTGRGLLLLILSSLCAVSGNLLLRGGILRAGGFSLSLDKLKPQMLSLSLQPMFVGGMFLYGVAAIVWFRILSTEDLSLSYPLMTSLTFVLVTLGATYFFDERLTWQKVLGLSIILAGFVLAART